MEKEEKRALTGTNGPGRMREVADLHRMGANVRNVIIGMVGGFLLFLGVGIALAWHYGEVQRAEATAKAEAEQRQLEDDADARIRNVNEIIRSVESQ